VFDFGNGAGHDNVLLSQENSSNSMTLHMWRNGINYKCTAPNSIVAGETATWTTGITRAGVFYVDKNSVRLATCNVGVVPANVSRTKKLVGRSNFAADTPLNGEVVSLVITNI
jgi:serralysin